MIFFPEGRCTVDSSEFSYFRKFQESMSSSGRNLFIRLRLPTSCPKQLKLKAPCTVVLKKGIFLDSTPPAKKFLGYYLVRFDVHAIVGCVRRITNC